MARFTEGRTGVEQTIAFANGAWQTTMHTYFAIVKALREEDLAIANLDFGNNSGLRGFCFDNLDNFGSFVAVDTELTSCSQ